MAAEVQHGLVGVAGEDRGEDRGVFAGDVAIGVEAEGNRPASVELGGVAEGPGDVLQSLVSQPSSRRAVKLGVRRDPVIAEAFGIVGIELRARLRR